MKMIGHHTNVLYTIDTIERYMGVQSLYFGVKESGDLFCDLLTAQETTHSLHILLDVALLYGRRQNFIPLEEQIQPLEPAWPDKCYIYVLTDIHQDSFCHCKVRAK